MDKKFRPKKLVVVVDEVAIKRHVEGRTTYKDKAVLKIDREAKKMTICESYDRTDKRKCMDCLDYGVCPVYMRR